MNIDQTSTKNEAKNLPKMDENQAKAAPRDALVGSWPSRAQAPRCLVSGCMDFGDTLSACLIYFHMIWE